MIACTHHRSAKAKRCKSCAIKAMWADPEFRARKNRQSGDTLRRLKQDPAFRAKEDSARRRNVAVMNATRRPLTAEEIKLRNLRVSARKLSWCPPSMRDEYKRLVKSKRIPAAEARTIILDQFKRQIMNRGANQ